MSEFITPGFHINGPEKCNLRHNQRDTECIIKEKHIWTLEKLQKAGDPRASFWHPEYKSYIQKKFDDGTGHLMPIEQCYEIIFGDAIKEYDNKQKKNPSRKIGNGEAYYRKILKEYEHSHTNKRARVKHPAPYFEIIVGLYSHYGTDPDTLMTQEQLINREWVMSEEEQKELLGKYIQSFKKRNPNMIVIAAYWHADENGQCHIHMDIICIGNKSRGLSKVVSQTKAIEASGKAQGKDFSLIPKTEYTKTKFPKDQWIASEVEELDRMCREHGYEVMHPVQQGRAKKKKDLDKSEYIMKAETEENIRLSSHYQKQNEELKRKIDLQDTRLKEYQYILETTENEKILLEKETSHLKDEKDLLIKENEHLKQLVYVFSAKLVDLKKKLDGFLKKCDNAIAVVDKKISALAEAKNYLARITQKALSNFEKEAQGITNKMMVERIKKQKHKTITESMLNYAGVDDDAITDVSKELISVRTDLYETVDELQTAMRGFSISLQNSSVDTADEKDIDEEKQ